MAVIAPGFGEDPDLPHPELAVGCAYLDHQVRVGPAEPDHQRGGEAVGACIVENIGSAKSDG